jgi:nucleotide-binding universal stress UspA family protein
MAPAQREYPQVPFPYKRILCPVDFDGHSDDALKEAAALALNGGGTMHVLHVLRINPLVDQGAGEGFAAAELYESQVSFAQKQIEQILGHPPPEVKREGSTAIGEPGDRILEAATSLNADIIVMATHGRRGIRHFVLGSIAERVVRESKIPVLVVRPSANKPPQ